MKMSEYNSNRPTIALDAEAATAQVEMWLDERVDSYRDGYVGAQAAYDDYRAWARKGDREVLTQTRFGRALGLELDVVKVRANRGMRYLGIVLRAGS